MMSGAPLRPTIDVSELPDNAFGHHNMVWWGTLGFVVIEGFTLAMAAVVWIYLAQSMGQWPPYGTPLPTLMASTVLVIVMLLSIPLMLWMCRAARAYDYRRTRLGVTIATLVCVVFVSLRMVELTRSLHVRWDTNAYGSAQWLVIGLHGTLLLMQLVEMGGIALAFWFGTIEKKHFSDADDAAFYWYFIVASWIPLFVMCFLVPRFL
jgi:cytochrome c oxidase subunit III